MKRIFGPAVICSFLAVSGALAQSPTSSPPPAGPTEVQCSEGYKDGMSWTREQFTKACADLKDRKKP